MIEVNFHGELGGEEHMQPWDQVGDLEDQQGESGAEEPFVEVAHDIESTRDLNRE